MNQTVDALYENGVLVPLGSLTGIAEHGRVRVTVEPVVPRAHPLAGCLGTLPTEDAEEMLRIMDAEFETVDLDAWRGGHHNETGLKPR